MNLLGNICAACTISCSIYTTWRLLKYADTKRNNTVQQLSGESKKKTSNETPRTPSDSSTNRRVPDENSLIGTNANAINNNNMEYYNIITIENERYENTFLNIQSIVDGHTSSINDMKAIVEEQQKIIEEQRLINSKLLLKLNENKTEEKSKSDLYSIDKKYFIEYCTRTNKRINEISSKMSSLKSVRVVKNELKALRSKFVNTKKYIMSTQSIQKKQFDEKISKIVRKHDKLKTKGDMMSLYTMGFKSCSFANMSTARNEFYLPEMNTRNSNNAYQMPVDIATSTVQAILKIPVPPPMPLTSSTSTSNLSPQPSVVPPVPPMPPTPPANLFDVYGRHGVTKSLLKTVTLGPIGDKPRKIKKPQCMIDASKKRADAAMAAASVSSAVAVVADTTVTVQSGPSSLSEMPSLLLQVSEEVTELPALHVNVFENFSLDGDDDDDDEMKNDVIIPEEPNVPLSEILEISHDATIVGEQITPESASTDGIDGVSGFIPT